MTVATSYSLGPGTIPKGRENYNPYDPAQNPYMAEAQKNPALLGQYTSFLDKGPYAGLKGVPPGSGTSIPAYEAGIMAKDRLGRDYPVAAPYAPPPAPPTTPLPPEEQKAAETTASQQVSSSLAGQTFAPLLDTLHGIGMPQIAPFAPVAPRFEGQAPVATARPDNSYYQNLFGAKFAPLNQDYFGRGGLSDQAVGEANRRGFLTAGPSGVAGQLYEKTIANPYARELGNIQNQVNIIKTETEMDLAKYDATRQDDFRKFQADLIMKDRDYGVASVEAQAHIDNTYLSLESEINQAIASGATNEKLGELNARVNTFQSLIAAETAKAQLNQQAAIEAAKLEEERLARQGNFWINASGTPGAISGNTPYGPLDQPPPNAVDENGNAVGGTQYYDNPGIGSTSTGNKIRMENPGSNGAPANEVTIDGQIMTGTDGNQWRWSRSSGRWVSIG